MASSAPEPASADAAASYDAAAPAVDASAADLHAAESGPPPMGAIVARAERSGWPLSRGSDAVCKEYAGRPHHYSIRQDGPTDRAVFDGLADLCVPIASLEEPDVDHWCCPSGPPKGRDACATDDDCVWSYLRSDISTRASCSCRVCPSAPVTRTVDARRTRQYAAQCQPQFNGRGERCPVARCAPLPPLVCERGTCMSDGVAR